MGFARTGRHVESAVWSGSMSPVSGQLLGDGTVFTTPAGAALVVAPLSAGECDVVPRSAVRTSVAWGPRYSSVPHAPLNTASTRSGPCVVGMRANRMSAPLSPCARSCHILYDTFCGVALTAGGSGSVAAESAHRATTPESAMRMNVPLSLRTETRTGFPG